MLCKLNVYVQQKLDVTQFYCQGRVKELLLNKRINFLFLGNLLMSLSLQRITRAHAS